MREHICEKDEMLVDVSCLSLGERKEMIGLGLLSGDGRVHSYSSPGVQGEKPRIPRRAVHVPRVLNEAYDYSTPSSFSRGLCLEMNGMRLLLISGTASVDEAGRTVHVGDFRAQCWRTYRNITEILESEGMSWGDIVRTTCYLRDIERDYQDFNEVRTAFFRWLGLDPLPASTGIQARLCREDLLIEIEAIAAAPTNGRK